MLNHYDADLATYTAFETNQEFGLDSEEKIKRKANGSDIVGGYSGPSDSLLTCKIQAEFQP